MASTGVSSANVSIEDHSLHTEGSFLHVFHVACLLLIFVTAIIGNSLVIHVIKLDSRLHMPTFYFLVNLCAADIFTAVAYIPFYVVSVIQHSWVFGEEFCQIHAFLISLGFNASLITLSLVSFDRYLAITSPLKYPLKMTGRRMRWLLVLSWVHSIIWAAFPLVNWGEYMSDPHTHTCRPNWSAAGLISKSYVICMACFVFAIPVLVMIFCYAKIFTAARVQVRKIVKDSISQSVASLNTDAEQSISGLGETRRHQDMRAHKTILIIIVVFLMCWVAYVIVALTRLFKKDPMGSLRFTNTGLTLALMSCSVNPLIFSSRDRRFKRGFRKFFRDCLLKCRQ